MSQTILTKRLTATFVSMLMYIVAMAQTLSVTGNVKDTSGEPITGASLMVEGTSNGAVSDLDGNFYINNVPSNAKIRVSYIGYDTQTISLNGRNTLNIILTSSDRSLDEVVVIGYGTVRKVDLAGAVGTMNAKQFRDQPVTSVSDALQGRMSGVQVENSGVPGGSVKIRVRGSSSVSKSNEPLVVVDGIVRESGMDGINPDDIESLQILKDASSTAIYGSRGSNGVILVQTKSGRSGIKQVTFESSIGISNIAKKMDVMNAQEFANAYMSVKGTDATLQEYANGRTGIDWQDEIFRTGTTQQYKIGITNGNQDTQFYLSGDYMKRNGIVMNTNNESFRGKANVTSKIFDWLHVTADVTGQHSTRTTSDFGNTPSNVISTALIYSPTMALQDENGNYNLDPYNSKVAANSNPIGRLKLMTGNSVKDVFSGKVDLRFNIMKGLTFTNTEGYEYYGLKTYSFSTRMVSGANSSMQNNDIYRRQFQTTNNLTYNGSFGPHHITATAVYEATKSQTRSMGITGTNLLTESVGWWNVSLASSKDATNAYSAWSLQSWVGRAVYSFDNRYIATATFRADGSSKFTNKKWGYFPSVALAWNLSQENFMKNFKAVQDIKIRASYGLIGNQDIEPYSTMGLLERALFDFGTAGDYTGYWAANVATPDLTWEKTKQFDLGLDFSLWNGRINISLDYYNKNTYDALLQTTLPNYRGGQTYWTNAGKINNKGLDFSVSARIFEGPKVYWQSTISGSYMKNKVKDLGGKDYFFGTSVGSAVVTEQSIIKVGESIGSFYGYVWTGLDANGHDTYADLNNNGQLDGGDRQVIGKSTPDLTLGWNNTVQFGRWDFSAFFNASFGAQRLNLLRYNMSSAASLTNFVTLKEAYQKNFDNAGASAFYPSLRGSNQYRGASTKWVEDADFLRLENISVAYTFPRNTTKFADIRLALSAQNLFTITGYKGMDPAGSTFSSGHADVNSGIDIGAYPLARSFTFGVKFTF